MKRIVAITAAILAAVIIIGISVHSINQIDKMNQKKYEEEAAKAFASEAAQTTAATDIWEFIHSAEERNTEATQTETTVSEEQAETAAPEEDDEDEGGLFDRDDDEHDNDQTVTTAVNVGEESED